MLILAWPLGVGVGDVCLGGWVPTWALDRPVIILGKVAPQDVQWLHVSREQPILQEGNHRMFQPLTAQALRAPSNY